MESIHISEARKILDSHKDVDLCWWTQKGEIRHHMCRSLRYDFATGTRNVRIMPSGQIRKLTDFMIFRINGMEVYL